MDLQDVAPLADGELELHLAERTLGDPRRSWVPAYRFDMRVTGVPNEVLRDHCRTYKNVGVGYYPNSLFVHFDVRSKSTFWVDLSKPGEAPKYVNGQGDFDHALDEAAADGADLSPKDEAAGAASSSAPPPLPPLPAASATVGQK